MEKGDGQGGRGVYCYLTAGKDETMGYVNTFDEGLDRRGCKRGECCAGSLLRHYVHRLMAFYLYCRVSVHVA